MTLEEIRKIRGEVADKLTHLDNALCNLISMHYFSEIRNDFIFDILYEHNVAVSSKKNMLINIFRRKNLDLSYLRDIDRLFQIRNIFAHAWTINCGDTPDGTDSAAINTLELRENDKNEHDAQGLKIEFDTKCIKVQRYLFRIMGCDQAKEGIQTITNKREWDVDAHDVGKDGKTKFTDSCPCGSKNIYKNCCGK